MNLDDTLEKIKELSASLKDGDNFIKIIKIQDYTALLIENIQDLDNADMIKIYNTYTDIGFVCSRGDFLTKTIKGILG